MVKVKFNCRNPDCLKSNWDVIPTLDNLPSWEMCQHCYTDHPVIGVEKLNGVWLLKVRAGRPMDEEGL
jgi:hypothetical protein